MSKEITIKFYADPGHGWGCVKIALLKELGIVVGDISTYSYVKGKSIYLEEDCDLSMLIRVIQAKGFTYKYVHKHTDNQSQIRSYPSTTSKVLAVVLAD